MHGNAYGPPSGGELAVALIYDPASDRVWHQPFNGERALDYAHAFADDLRERGDFPGALITVTGNDAATEARQARIMASLGFGND